MEKILNSGIYSIKNIVDGKRYIGRASYIDKRKSEHFRTLRLQKHTNIHLQRAYNKYGKENFVFEVIEYCSKDTLIIREDYWCRIFKTNCRELGYNLALTGESHFIAHSQESKDRISKALKGKKKSRDSVEKMRNTKKGSKLTEQHKANIKKWFVENEHPMVKGHTDEAKLKMSKSRKGKPSNNRRKIKAINVYSNKEFTYSSILEAAKDLDVLNTSIQNNLKGKSKLVDRKFKFEYYE